MTHEPAGDTLAEVGRIATALADVCLRAVGALKDLKQDDYVLVPDPVDEQVEPAVEEPEEFASVVKARDILATTYKTGLFWTRVTGSWMDDVAGCERQWDQLEVVEVLRVGLHDPDPNSYDDGVLEGKREMNTAIHGRVVSLLEGTLLKERATAYEHVLKAVEELAP